jgi:hypothetical protein
MKPRVRFLAAFIPSAGSKCIRGLEMTLHAENSVVTQSLLKEEGRVGRT